MMMMNNLEIVCFLSGKSGSNRGGASHNKQLSAEDNVATSGN